jgi:hypothetical protein
LLVSLRYRSAHAEISVRLDPARENFGLSVAPVAGALAGRGVAVRTLLFMIGAPCPDQDVNEASVEGWVPV